MTSSAEFPDPVRRIRRLQKLTIAWMIAEAILSLWAAFRANSPALLAFGGDSAIELLSAAVVLWRFQDRNGKRSGEVAEKSAAQIAGILLLALALYVVAVACTTLFGLTESSPSYVGIGVLIAATAVMPWLAWQKQRLATITASAALRADAAESMLCAYLSLSCLAWALRPRLAALFLGRPNCRSGGNPIPTLGGSTRVARRCVRLLDTPNSL